MGELSGAGERGLVGGFERWWMSGGWGEGDVFAKE